MKRCFFTLICACLAMCLLAETPRLTRAQLKDAKFVKDQTIQLQPDGDKSNSMSLQPVLKDRHLAHDDNKLNSKSSHIRSANDSLDYRIALVDAYNFVWDDSAQVAVIQENSCVAKGVFCNLLRSGGKLYLTNFYGSYEIPIYINDSTGVVRIKTGKVLDTIKNYSGGNSESDAKGSSFTPQSWSLYAMPLSWLAGDDEYEEYIQGHVHGDSIEFDDDFAFLVKTYVDGEYTWGMSTIFKNLVFLKPNALHTFERHLNSLNSDINVNPDPYQEEAMAHGGLVPRPVKPGSTKPIKPRAMSSLLGGAGPEGGEPDCEGAPSFQTSGLYASSSSSNVQNVSMPVYIYQLDETTLWVYNLFGLGNRCTMYINGDGTMTLPRQVISSDGLGKNEYSTSASSGTWSSSGITWNRTQKGNALGDYYCNNHLNYTLDMSSFGVPAPSFLPPVVGDDAVMFRANSNGGIVYMFVYNEETESYEKVSNPWSAPRGDDPYVVELVAYTYDDLSGECSEEVYLEYEVPVYTGESWRPEGTVKYYMRAGKALTVTYSDDWYYTDTDQAGFIMAVEDGNTIWFKNLFYDPDSYFASNFGDYWIEGKKRGIRVTVALDQNIWYSSEDDAYVRLGWGNTYLYNGSLGFYHKPVQTTANFIISGDVLTLENARHTGNYTGQGLVAYWSDDETFAGGALYNTTLTSVGELPEPELYTDDDIAAMSGELVQYNRWGYAIYRVTTEDDDDLELGDQTGVNSIFFDEDGETVYMRDPVYTWAGHGYWMKGTKDGDTLTFPLGQYVYWNPETLKGLKTSWGTFVMGEGYIDNPDVTEVTFTIEDDHILMNNSGIDEEETTFIGLSLMVESAFGESGWYGGFDFYTCYFIIPGIPTDVAVRPHRTTADVSWQDAENEMWNVRYREVVEEGEEPAEWIYYEELDSAIFTIGGLTAGTSYEVQVQGMNNGGYGEWTEPVVFTTLPDHLRGDVNDDGFVNISDVTALINVLLTDDWDTINVANADCNNDENLNISDVTTLINYLLTDQWPD